MADAVELKRRVGAAPEVVFRAFTEPSFLTRWFSPEDDIRTVVIEHDLREGGRYRFAFRFPGGEESVVLGEFLEISRPGRLIFSWSWEEPDPHAGIETRVTVTLLGDEGGTEIVVRHERFPDGGSRRRHDEGWRSTLDRLADLLGALERRER